LWPQGYERKATRKKFHCEGACGHRAMKGKQQENKFIVKVLVATLRYEISDYVLSLRPTSTKYFSYPSSVNYFFSMPPVKVKLELQTCGGLPNSKHYRWPIRNRDQQSNRIYYTLLWQLL